MNRKTQIVIFKDPNPYDELNYGYLLLAPHSAKDSEYMIKNGVPLGMPYNIVNISDLPNNFFEEKDFYTFNFSNPDGIGSGSYSYVSASVTIDVVSDVMPTYKEWEEAKNV